MYNTFFLFIKKSARIFLNPLVKFYKLKIIKDPSTIVITQWNKDAGDATHRLNYPLTKNSIIFDVGGYKGDWSQKIIKLYTPYIYIFEPVPKHCSKIRDRFKLNPKVSICNFGLSDKNTTQEIAVLSDGSSVYRTGANYVDIVLKDIFHFLKEKNISKVDLIKINVEGGEYSLLERMIDKQIIENFKNIQVQFHKFFPNSAQRRNAIRNALSKTHFITYDYPFIWENWQRKL